MNLKTSLGIFIGFLVSVCSFGQMSDYNYYRELRDVSGPWHSITLPNDIFSKLNSTFSDVRIYGIKSNGDTIEAPYLFQVAAGKSAKKEIGFKTLNTSHTGNGYYFTFEVPGEETVNQIRLEFENKNYDWLINLEGSQSQDEWFTILHDYRILSIKNVLTDYQFDKLRFPDSRYRYYRISINAKDQPVLSRASVEKTEYTEGQFRDYTVGKTEIVQNKKDRQTEIAIGLDMPVPVSKVRIRVSDTIDYYRPVTFSYLTDSFQTDQGWKYNYARLFSGTLNSMEANDFPFSSTILQRLRIVVHNQDNQPLHIDSVSVSGHVHALTTRLTEPASYYLTYGNKSAIAPEYDIARFVNNIPESPAPLAFGEEKTIGKDKLPSAEPLFMNKMWLWAILGLVIILLGWFTIRMMRHP